MIQFFPSREFWLRFSSRSIFRVGGVSLLFALLVGWSSLAHSVTVGDLVSGNGSFSSGNSKLVFSDFSASDVDDVSSPISGVEILPTLDGFSLDDIVLSPLLEGGSARWLIEFTVTTAPGFFLDSSSISFIGERQSDYDLDNGTSLADQDLSVQSDSGHSVAAPAGRIVPAQVFAETVGLVNGVSLHVMFVMDTDDFNTGGVLPGEGFSSLWGFANSYSTIPEPSTALLLGLGLLALGARRGSA